MSISTRTGDDGSTGLMYGRRVPKNNVRVEAYGTVDELNAALGMARALATEIPLISDFLLATQKELVVLMGELAVALEDRERYVGDQFELVTTGMVDRLSQFVRFLEKDHAIHFQGWATPGATHLAAALDVARTVCRRAERRCADLADVGGVPNPEIGRYLNRLSDVCWLLARFEETRHGS